MRRQPRWLDDVSGEEQMKKAAISRVGCNPPGWRGQPSIHKKQGAVRVYSHPCQASKPNTRIGEVPLVVQSGFRSR
ncbi:MAG: hypothetical protein MUO64_21920 [Anaerolineales bacterium]|nr:hypothetical protein [Anaerolineales bacterium]